MSQTKTQDTPVYEYRRAKNTADRVMELLTPHCEVIHIAGSIRREKDFVKDIEIVCIPKKVFHAEDLFGGGKKVIAPGFVEAIDHMKEKTIKGNVTGRYMQMILKGGKVLDLFMPVPNDYYRQFAIRTGSREYSNKVIATSWLALGWCGVSNVGLRRKSDCTFYKDKADKIVWKLINANGEKPPVWKSEKDFFEWLGVRWIEPRLRG